MAFVKEDDVYPYIIYALQFSGPSKDTTRFPGLEAVPQSARTGAISESICTGMSHVTFNVATIFDRTGADALLVEEDFVTHKAKRVNHKVKRTMQNENSKNFCNAFIYLFVVKHSFTPLQWPQQK